MRLPVQMAVCAERLDGAPSVATGSHMFATESNRPPVPALPESGVPPQTIMVPAASITAVWPLRPEGALVTGIVVQLSATGSYSPPVLRPEPPQTIIRLPVQTAACPVRAEGEVVEVAVHVSVCGLYLPPLERLTDPFVPPQMIMVVPV